MRLFRFFEKKTITGIILFTMVYFSSHAETFYVDGSHEQADDGNTGTLEQPWLTIGHAAESVSPGDTVYIRTGVYFEHVYFDQGGNASDWIVFTAYPGEAPALDGTGVSESQNGMVIDKSYLVIRGLEIRNWTENAVWMENASFVEISDCTIHDVCYGIGVAENSHDLVFNNVTAHHFDLYGFDVTSSQGEECHDIIFNDCTAHTGRDPRQNVDGFALGHGNQSGFTFNRCRTWNVFDGFDISSQQTILNSCLAYGCWNGGYKLWQDRVTLMNCIGYDCDVSVVELDWDEEPGRTTLFNCTFFASGTFTVWVENSADTLHMYNCILAGGDNIGLAFEQVGISNYRGDYNLFHNDNTARAVAAGYENEFTLSEVGSGVWTSHSGQDAHSRISSDLSSVFMDAAGYDLHLSAGSPAVDGGTSSGAPSEDFEGNSRPAGAAHDIGAYEYTGSVAVPSQEAPTPPQTAVLYANYPNPFNPATTIRYRLDRSAYVELIVFDIIGRKIKTLIKGQQPAGKHYALWDGTDEQGRKADSGLYTCLLRVGSCKFSGKMLLLR